MLPCQQKIRYPTRAFAEAVQHGQLGTHGKLSAYFCQSHGCWHLGHDRRVRKRAFRFDWTPHYARGFVAQRRAALVAEFQVSQNLDLWRGVRVLSRVLMHLSR